MHSFFIFALLTIQAAAYAAGQQFSYSSPVGSGSGVAYLLSGEGPITAIRIWERQSNYIYGFQFRYGSVWSPVAGYMSGQSLEMELFEGETINQISGKYAHYLQTVVFSTNMGRTLAAGQPSGYSYAMYPSNKNAELRSISGRVHGAITSIAAHWAVVDSTD